ncbi:hypothetical protein [Lysobacter sp. Root690]|uniref:hypothetical protein n=1 Tax=Lysobacter sp. Root690 TaxID=1736588 RepID=UPI0006F61265|nr:hypothetical protein [Lysobacter sp. Root690]KRB10280.1 hypothetical protein ASD86_25115 [Lysobacter sp. Root690]
MSAAHMLPATLLLGGSGTIAVLGSPEAGARAPIYLVGGLAIWGVLALLWMLNIRAARYHAWALQNYRAGPPKAPKGAFWKGAGVGLLLTIGGLICAVYLLAHGGPGVQELAGWVLLIGGGWGLTLVPLVAGWAWVQIAATRIPRGSR